jgi:hypothetical protein
VLDRHGNQSGVLQEPFSFRLNRNGGSGSLFDAFSSREPVSTSLENALNQLTVSLRGAMLCPAASEA